MAESSVNFSEDVIKIRYQTLILTPRDPTSNDVEPSETAASSSSSQTPPRLIHDAITDKLYFHELFEHMFGVRQFRKWVGWKKSREEKFNSPAYLTSDILNLSDKDLNKCLSLFVTDIWSMKNKPTPDTIYYICLGIQCYLLDNRRTDDIFHDLQYINFIEALDAIAKCFVTPLINSYSFTTCIEEEHFWHLKQLGTVSPAVLVNTIVYFTTKYFHLTSVQEHKELSFANLKKQFRSKDGPSGRTIILPMQRSLTYFPSGNSSLLARNEVFEILETINDIRRCPISMYDIYLSKCPSGTILRRDALYLQPVENRTRGTPWFSENPLPDKVLEQMLHRASTTWEVNIELSKLVKQ